MKKIGIMGGTFNPIHNGHLTMAKEAKEQFELDEVWFMPAKNPPHKDENDIISDKHRISMIELAIAPFPAFFLSMLEIEREGVTYTIDTLNQLKATYPEDSFYFILGADSLFQIETWKNPAEIMKITHILSAPRYPKTLEEEKSRREYLQKKYKADIQLISMSPIQISSMEIRKRLVLHQSIVDYVPTKVEQYIKEHHLY